MFLTGSVYGLLFDPENGGSTLLRNVREFLRYYMVSDRLCSLLIRVPGYRSRCPGFDSRHYQIFWQAVGLERGPLSLTSMTEGLLGRKSSGFGLESREYGCRDLSRCPRDTLHLQKLVPTSPTRGGSSVGMVRSWTKATEFILHAVISQNKVFSTVAVIRTSNPARKTLSLPYPYC
jgi:hypothetical protein